MWGIEVESHMLKYYSLPLGLSISYIMNAIVIFISASYMKRFKPKKAGIFLIITGIIYFTIAYLVLFLFAELADSPSPRWWDTEIIITSVLGFYLSYFTSLILFFLGIAVLLKNRIASVFDKFEEKRKMPKILLASLKPSLIFNLAIINFKCLEYFHYLFGNLLGRLTGSYKYVEGISIILLYLSPLLVFITLIWISSIVYKRLSLWKPETYNTLFLNIILAISTISVIHLTVAGIKFFRHLPVIVSILIVALTIIITGLLIMWFEKRISTPKADKPKHKNTKIIITCAVLVILLFIPQVILTFQSSAKTFSDVEKIPAYKYGMLFGAKVYDDYSLSPVVRERMEAAVLLYKNNKIEKLFISGDNGHNSEVEIIKIHAIDNGVQAEDIITDYFGIDTHDTCKHFKETGEQSAILITQSFHLPRAMYMCRAEGIDGVGLAVNKLGLLESRGNSRLKIYYIRAKRFVRESVLTWTFILGIYDWYSDEAEKIIAEKY